MFTLDVKGFKAIKEASLKVDGFTAIVGPSNVGKSWLLKSIIYALSNKTGNHYHRGETSYDIYLKFAPASFFEEFTYRWTRQFSGKSAKSLIVINGVELPNVGRNPIDLSAYGIKSLTLDRSKYFPNYWEQFGVPFLVFESPAKIFQIFNKLFENDKILIVKKSVDLDLKRFRAEHESLSLSLQVLDSDESKYRLFLDEFVPQLKQMELDFDKIGFLQKAEIIATEYFLVLSRTQNLRELISKHKGLLNDLLDDFSFLNLCLIDLPVSDIISFSKIKRTISEISDVLVAFSTFSGIIEFFIGLDDLFSDFNEISKSLLDNRNELDITLNEFNKLKKSIKVCPYCGVSFV